MARIHRRSILACLSLAVALPGGWRGASAAAGGTRLSPPHPLPPQEAGPRNRFCYARMPFGPLVEFIAYPDPQPYRRETPLRRWTPPES